MKSIFFAAAFLGKIQSIKTPDGVPVYPLEFHFNEDPHSVPSPLSGKPYLTSTDAKHFRDG